MSRTEDETIRDLLGRFDEAMLITHDDDGAPHARPMAVAQSEPNGDLWFATSAGSRKIGEVRRDPRVAAVFEEGGRYLSISGHAEIVQDREKVHELWSPAWKPWFPKGEDDPDIVLLHVHARRGEYWDNRGAKGVGYLWDAAKAVWRGERLHEGGPERHGEVKL